MPKVDQSPLREIAGRAESSPRFQPQRQLLAFAAVALLLCVAFGSPLIAWARFAIGGERNTYLLLVPFISIYLIRTRREAPLASFQSSTGLALIPAALGVLALAALTGISLSINRLSIEIFALLNLLLASAFVFIGGNILRQFAFPVGLLLFVIPIPSGPAGAIERFLQITSAEAAYWLMSFIGIPMIRDGVNFRLPNIYIQVAQECSGYNSTFALFIVSLVAGYLFLKKRSRRAILSLAVIPLAILRNGVRITTIAALCVYVDPDLINSYIHHHGGPIFFALSLIPFFGLLWGLRKSEIAKDRT